MAKRMHIELTEEQRKRLESWVRNPPKPYLRDRARAILRIADGEPIYKVARTLRTAVHRDTVSNWVKRFLAEGCEGLKIKPGRGRKPVFSPLSRQEAQTQIEWVLHQSPRQYGIRRARWRLRDVQRAIAWLDGLSEPAIYKVLKRLGFSRKQALNFIHSPDPEYHAKWRAILNAFLQAVEHPGEVEILFLDELTYHRQPSKSSAYHRRGKSQPRAQQVPGSNTQTRIVAVLNGVTGRVTYMQRSKIGRDALVAFYARVRAAYPEAKTIYIVQDNWPIHKLPEVMTALAQHQLTPLFLPTYASWLNPIEKLWRWLKQDVIHLHTLAADLKRLRQQVIEFLDRFATASDALLRYVGLLPE
jgi:transposase